MVKTCSSDQSGYRTRGPRGAEDPAQGRGEASAARGRREAAPEESKGHGPLQKEQELPQLVASFEQELGDWGKEESFADWKEEVANSTYNKLESQICTTNEI